MPQYKLQYDRALIIELACRQKLAPLEVARRVGCSRGLVYQVRMGEEMWPKRRSVSDLLALRDWLRDHLMQTQERIRAVNGELRRRRQAGGDTAEKLVPQH